MQAKRLAGYVRNLGLCYDAVYSSDLMRALETAEIVVGPEKKKEIIIDERLRERGYGVFEGKKLHVLRDAAKMAGFNDKNYSSFLPDGAESLEEVRDRIQDFCHHQLLCKNHEDGGGGGKSPHPPPYASPSKGNGVTATVTTVVEASSSPPKNILLVTHGGVIREFMRFFRDSLKCQLPDGMREPLRVTPNTGVNVFRIIYRLNSPRDAFLDDQSNPTAILLRAECLRVHEVNHLENQHQGDHPDNVKGSEATLGASSSLSPSSSVKNTQSSSIEPKNHLVSPSSSSNETGVDSLRADLHLA